MKFEVEIDNKLLERLLARRHAMDGPITPEDWLKDHIAFNKQDIAKKIKVRVL